MIFGGASIASLLLKIEFARHGSLAGVIWATIIGFGVFYVGPATWLAFRSVSSDPEVSGASQQGVSR